MIYIVVQGKETLILGRLKNVTGSQIGTEALYRMNTRDHTNVPCTQRAKIKPEKDRFKMYKPV